jgi:hypothetical protein
MSDLNEATDNDVVIVPEKKKRGRKPKPKPENIEPHVPKKRGRKPKGGKIVINPLDKSKDSEYITENVILHLKCNSDDINNGSSNDIGTIEDDNLSFQVIDETTDVKQEESYQLMTATTDTELPIISHNIQEDLKKTEAFQPNKHISEKLVELQKNFYFNDIQTNNSACFWCTCGFDHTSVQIPKHKLNDQYSVYGCFCSPECAVAYLMSESIDTSQKYERYQLLNYLYSNIYNHVTNIKPAPDPRYFLDKYMGNLSIDEYRKLLSQDRLFMVVDKPITRILPEIYEETDLKGSQFETGYNKTSFQVKKTSAKPSTTKKNFFSA